MLKTIVKKILREQGGAKAKSMLTRGSVLIIGDIIRGEQEIVVEATVSNQEDCCYWYVHVPIVGGWPSSVYYMGERNLLE